MHSPLLCSFSTLAWYGELVLNCLVTSLLACFYSCQVQSQPLFCTDELTKGDTVLFYFKASCYRWENMTENYGCTSYCHN